MTTIRALQRPNEDAGAIRLDLDVRSKKDGEVDSRSIHWPRSYHRRRIEFHLAIFVT